MIRFALGWEIFDLKPSMMNAIPIIDNGMKNIPESIWSERSEASTLPWREKSWILRRRNELWIEPSGDAAKKMISVKFELSSCFEILMLSPKGTINVKIVNTDDHFVVNVFSPEMIAATNPSLWSWRRLLSIPQAKLKFFDISRSAAILSVKYSQDFVIII